MRTGDTILVVAFTASPYAHTVLSIMVVDEPSPNACCCVPVRRYFCRLLEVDKHFSHMRATATGSCECLFTATAQKLCCACRSPESLRDVRGFSVKFYTEEGNWDFVGNDIPVRSNPFLPRVHASCFIHSVPTRCMLKATFSH